MSDRKAVIVGGGFGGLTAALALRRAGIDPLVIERKAAEPATSHGSGGGLTLWSNAVAALASLGLDEQLVAGGSVLRRFDNRTSGGKTLARWRIDQMSDRTGWPCVNVEWEVLHRILSDAVGPGTVREGTCDGLREHGDTVSALLADGGEEPADLLIGADGLRSSIRRALLGDIQPRYAGYDVLRAVVPFEHPEAPPGVFVQTWGTGSRFGYYQVGTGRTYWFAVVNATRDGEVPDQDHRRFLEERMAGWAGPVGDLIRATPKTSISRLRVYDRDPIRSWGSGRATLLGDAAHPMTFNVGQGACQAIEDALALGKALGDSVDTTDALRGYEAARSVRTSTLVRRARWIGTMGTWRSPAACAVRNTALSVILPGPARRQHEQFISPS